MIRKKKKFLRPKKPFELFRIKEENALIAGNLLLKHHNVPITDAIIASYLRTGEADCVLTDDPHFKTLNVKTKWIP